MPVVLSKNNVLEKLQNLSINKSPGPDDINSRILVELGKFVAPSLSVLFQNSYDTANIPSDWENTKITPIYKKDDKRDPENYCPVSLTSILCKIMESIIKDHLLNISKITILFQTSSMDFYLEDPLPCNY